MNSFARRPKTPARQAFAAQTLRLFTLFRKRKSVEFMAALFTFFRGFAPKRGRQPAFADWQRPRLRFAPTPVSPRLWPKTPSDKRLALAARPFGVNLSKLVNWLHSIVFGHFQILAKNPKSQKPRLAKVSENRQKRPLHLTTFDQKPPGAENAVRRRPPEALSRGDLEKPSPLGVSRPSAEKVSDRRGFGGNFS